MYLLCGSGALGAILDGAFNLTGIDHDEVTETVKEHIIKSLVNTLVGLECEVKDDDVKIKHVSNMRNGNQSVSFQINLKGVAHDAPVVAQVSTHELSLASGLHKPCQLEPTLINGLAHFAI